MSHTTVHIRPPTIPNTWLPIAALQDAVTRGSVGALANELIGMPTDRSQRATLERDAPDVLAACVDLRADVALLVPNCPVCHQSVSLVARHLEGRRHPNRRDGLRARHRRTRRRAAFSFQRLSARQLRRQTVRRRLATRTLAQALALFESSTAPRTTFVSPQIWSRRPALETRLFQRRPRCRPRNSHVAAPNSRSRKSSPSS